MVFILLISNAVQNAMVGADSIHCWVGLTAATTLFVVNYIFKYLQYRFPKSNKMVEGGVTILIYKGKILKLNLKKVKIAEYELMEAV